MTDDPPTVRSPGSASPGPITAEERITSLDAIRGVATLGILPMNALLFGLEHDAYFNVAADGIQQPLDWVIGVLTMVLIDQKMMALFSLLFGVGVVVFADRARAKGRRVALLSLWRFALLGGIGYAHSLLWEGDILLVYAVSAPIVLLVRPLPPKPLIGVGVATSLGLSVVAPQFFDWYRLETFGRALGLMLVGVGVYRLGIVQGQRDDGYYRRMAIWGLGVGGVLSSMRIVLQIARGWSTDFVATGLPTGLGMIPMALGYMALLIMWNRRRGRHVERFRMVGRMALSNYLTQTLLGVTMLTWWLGDVDLSRTMIAVWMLGVWALQLWWSTWWLSRFRYGPFEWTWRCATYRSWQPLRHAAGSRPVAGRRG